jgi:putative SOS response-associated peptidase YedK
MLTLAGYYDIHKESMLFTYTIITVNATESFAGIHDRMPAVLEDKEAIDQWLDPSIPTSQVVKHINPNGSSCLSWHPVSSIVNNVRNKSPECIAKINLSEKPPINKKGTLLNFFKPIAKEPKCSDVQEAEPLLKKPKLE